MSALLADIWDLFDLLAQRFLPAVVTIMSALLADISCQPAIMCCVVTASLSTLKPDPSLSVRKHHLPCRQYVSYPSQGSIMMIAVAIVTLGVWHDLARRLGSLVL